MNEIVANGTIGLLMILLQEENPLFIVVALRFLLILGISALVAGLFAWAFDMWKHALKK